MQARDLEAEKKELEAQVNGSKTSLSGVQRSLAVSPIFFFMPLKYMPSFHSGLKTTVQQDKQ